MSAERPADRGGLRDLDSHASWREVYVALDVDTTGHETGVNSDGR